MMKSFLPILLSVALLATGGFLAAIQQSNNDLNEALSISNSNALSMARDKEVFHSQILALKNRADSLNLTSGNLEESLNNSKSILADQETRITKLINAFGELNKKYDDVLNHEKQRFKRLADLSLINGQLVSENKKLNERLVGLIESSQRLATELSTAKGLEKDNIFIEPVDEDNRPCAVGSRVKKIVATLSLPSEIKSPAFKVFDPDGKPLPDQGGHFEFVASNESNSQKMKKLELTYLLPKKIGSGLYRVEIANEGKHIGNLLMRFR